MIKLFPAMILLLAVSAFAQKADRAHGTYAENGRLIAITDLSALSDCSAQSAVGQVASVKLDGDVAKVRLTSKKEGRDIEIPLVKLESDDRGAIFKDLVRKKVVIRVTGYTCEADGPLTAFSIDRNY